jgi:hypothetical protein
MYKYTNIKPCYRLISSTVEHWREFLNITRYNLPLACSKVFGNKPTLCRVANDTADRRYSVLHAVPNETNIYAGIRHRLAHAADDTQ